MFGLLAQKPAARMTRVRSATETKDVAAVSPVVPAFVPKQPEPTLQSLMGFRAAGPELINGRTAMVAIWGIQVTDLFTDLSPIEQLASPDGLLRAAALILAVTAASFGPAITGTPASKIFPNENDAVADGPLPYFWTPLAEKINGRVAMLAVAGVLLADLKDALN